MTPSIVSILSNVPWERVNLPYDGNREARSLLYSFFNSTFSTLRSRIDELFHCMFLGPNPAPGSFYIADAALALVPHVRESLRPLLLHIHGSYMSVSAEDLQFSHDMTLDHDAPVFDLAVSSRSRDIRLAACQSLYYLGPRVLTTVPNAEARLLTSLRATSDSSTLGGFCVSFGRLFMETERYVQEVQAACSPPCWAKTSDTSSREGRAPDVSRSRKRSLTPTRTPPSSFLMASVSIPVACSTRITLSIASAFGAAMKKLGLPTNRSFSERTHQASVAPLSLNASTNCFAIGWTLRTSFPSLANAV